MPGPADDRDQRGTASTSFGPFADQYDSTIGEGENYGHRRTIDPAMWQCIGDVAGAAVYDIACGNGYFARAVVRAGAAECWASDISPELIAIARRRSTGTAIEYSVRDAADFAGVPEHHFDVAMMNMAIFYVGDLHRFFAGVAASLRAGGSFVFSIDHPLRHLAYVDIGLDFIDPVAESRRYLADEIQHNFNPWTGKDDLVYRNRPLSTYLNVAADAGLHTTRLIEPPTATTYLDEPAHSAIPYKAVVRMEKCEPVT